MIKNLQNNELKEVSGGGILDDAKNAFTNIMKAITNSITASYYIDQNCKRNVQMSISLDNCMREHPHIKTNFGSARNDCIEIMCLSNKKIL